jgi:hypothetical protein
MDRIIDSSYLDGWIPIRLHWTQQEAMVDWCYLGDESFTDPFFNQTVERCLRLPFNLLFRQQTSMDLLGELSERRPGLPPSGFIFHMSRCGSTLVAQILAATPGSIVISESPPVDSIVRARLRNSSLAEESQIRWLQWMLGALGQPRTGDEKYFFVKFDAWNVLDLSLIRRAFPNVPWIFLYRDPIEVLVSQLGHRGAHMVPGVIDPILFGMDMKTATSVCPEEYCARVLASICELGLQSHEDGGKLMNYSELPAAVWTTLPGFFGITFSEVEIERMRVASQPDAKNPSTVFAEDGTRKKEKATQLVRDAARKWLYPVYEQLEAARLQGAMNFSPGNPP